MARIRSIKPEFWTNDRVTDCARDARLLFIGLWNFVDDAGRMKCSAKQIKGLIFPHDDISLGQLEDMLEELADRGLIETYEVDEKRYLSVTGWREHQRIDKPQPSRCPAPVAEPSRPFDDHSTNVRDGVDGKGEERKTDSRVVADATVREVFDDFWKVRIKREGPDPRDPAWREFAKAVRQGADPPIIAAGMRRYAEMFAEKAGTRFLPRTEKWLRERTWEDYQPSVALDPRDHGQVWLRADDERFKAWDQHHRKARGRGLPTDLRGGWCLPGDWPPGHPKAGQTRQSAPGLPLGPVRVAGGAR